MTKAEEIFNTKAYYNKWLKELTYDEKDLVLEMINEAQEDAYNQALEDSCNHDKVDVYYDENVGYCSTRQSILKLKK